MSCLLSVKTTCPLGKVKHVCPSVGTETFEWCAAREPGHWSIDQVKWESQTVADTWSNPWDGKRQQRKEVRLLEEMGMFGHRRRRLSQVKPTTRKEVWDVGDGGGMSAKECWKLRGKNQRIEEDIIWVKRRNRKKISQDGMRGWEEHERGRDSG